MALASPALKETSLRLAKLPYGSRTALPRGVEAQVNLEYEFERSIMRLSAEVLAHRLDTEARTWSWKAPATAWDHVKRDWLPTFTRWFKWKVNEQVYTKTIRVTDYHTFPHATVRYPPELGEVVIKQIVHEASDSWVREA